MRKINAAAGMMFGIFAAASFFLYITTCAWLVKELLLLVSIMLSCFGCGLYLSKL